MSDPRPTPLDMRDVSAELGDRAVLAGCTLLLPPGESVGVVGREGSGKSTLLRCCAGLHPVTAGRLRVCGREISSLAGRSVRRVQAQLGFVSQLRGLLSNRTLRENVELPARYHGRLQEQSDRIDSLIDRLGITPYADRVPSAAPEGVQRRAALARALSMGPGLLLADHLLSGIGTDAARGIASAVGEARERDGAAVVITGHHAEEMKGVVDRVLLLEDGRLHDA